MFLSHLQTRQPSFFETSQDFLLRSGHDTYYSYRVQLVSLSLPPFLHSCCHLHKPILFLPASLQIHTTDQNNRWHTVRASIQSRASEHHPLCYQHTLPLPLQDWYHQSEDWCNPGISLSIQN